MKILIIEDDPIISQNIKEALEAENMTSEIASDGKSGEYFLKHKKYDCVILDINLPHKNGYEICKQFRTEDKRTPVILLTAFDELDDKVQGFDSGADDYLTKPFYMKELIIRIQSLIKRSKNTSANETENSIEIEDLKIDIQNKIVTRNGIDINLTPREFQILLKLVTAKGKLVSKQELLKEIWGSSLEFNTNNIEVYINFLRNKVDRPFEKALIKTKVGYGYYIDSKK
jgi:DNA-binding response OmpR family regulator